MNILVTGAAGFIGSHLAERLAQLGHSVRGLDCLTPFYSRALKELNVEAIRRAGVNFLPLDLAVDDLSSALRDVDVVYHLTAQPGLSPGSTFETYLRNNVLATQRLVEAVREVPGFRSARSATLAAVLVRTAARTSRYAGSSAWLVSSSRACTAPRLGGTSNTSQSSACVSRRERRNRPESKAEKAVRRGPKEELPTPGGNSARVWVRQ